MALLAPEERSQIPPIAAVAATNKVRVLYLDTTHFFGPLMQVHGRVIRFLDPERFDAYLLADPKSGSAQDLRNLPNLGIWVQPLAGLENEKEGGWQGLHRLVNDIRILAGLPLAAWKTWRWKVALLHVGMTVRMLAVGLFLSLASGARLVIHVHESPKPGTGLKRLLFKASLARASRVIAVSGFIKDQLIAAGGNSEKITAVLNTVDLTRFHPGVSGEGIRSQYGIAPDDVLVVCLGRFIPGKGQLYLARAMAMVHSEAPKVKALLIGWEDPTPLAGGLSYKEEVVQYCREYDLENTVIIGPPRPEAPEIMAAADIVAVPSTNDPCPLTVLEALASGKPVVAFRSGGIPEEVGTGEDAILVEPGEEISLALAILRLGCDADLRRELGQRARQRAERHFYEERLAEEVMQVYLEVIRGVPMVTQGTPSGDSHR